MSDERDELAELIDKTDDAWMGVASARDWAGAMADAVLAAGYRKPRTVTTVEELEELPTGTVIRTEQGGIYEAYEVANVRPTRRWLETGSASPSDAYWLSLPVTVLHTPEEAP